MSWRDWSRKRWNVIRGALRSFLNGRPVPSPFGKRERCQHIILSSLKEKRRHVLELGLQWDPSGSWGTLQHTDSIRFPLPSQQCCYGIHLSPEGLYSTLYKQTPSVFPLLHNKVKRYLTNINTNLFGFVFKNIFGGKFIDVLVTITSKVSTDKFIMLMAHCQFIFELDRKSLWSVYLKSSLAKSLDSVFFSPIFSVHLMCPCNHKSQNHSRTCRWFSRCLD